MAVLNLSAVGIAALTVAIGFILWKYAGRQRPPLPPGPRGIPILGSALDIPKDYPEHQFAKWGGCIWYAIALHILLRVLLMTKLRSRRHNEHNGTWHPHDYPQLLTCSHCAAPAEVPHHIRPPLYQIWRRNGRMAGAAVVHAVRTTVERSAQSPASGHRHDA